jgi:hypothetical protein
MRYWLCTVALVAVAQTGLPSFRSYGIAERFTGKPAAPILATPGDRAFRTRIREGAAKGPNFAGHYTVAEWGCGTSCVSAVVVDAKTGKVYGVPFSILGYGYGLQYGDGISARDANFDPLAYKINSRLLIVRGCPEDEKCGAY